jgi:hypothetical protein
MKHYVFRMVECKEDDRAREVLESREDFRFGDASFCCFRDDSPNGQPDTTLFWSEVDLLVHGVDLETVADCEIESFWTDRDGTRTERFSLVGEGEDDDS